MSARFLHVWIAALALAGMTLAVRPLAGEVKVEQAPGPAATAPGDSGTVPITGARASGTARVSSAPLPASAAAAPTAPALASTSGAPLGYAGTPPDLVPYHEVAHPYHRYYLTPPFILPPPHPVDLPANEVRIGLLAPLSGSADVPAGQEMLHALTMAVDEANARGGCKGKPIRIVPENALPIWGASGNAVVKLCDQGVSAIVGAHATDDSHVALRLALKMEIPIVNGTTTDPTLTEHGVPWMVRTCASDRNCGYRMAQRIFQELGLRRVAVLRENSSLGRRGIMKFRSAAARLKAPIPIEMRYLRGDSDFSMQIARIKEEKPDALFLWSRAREGGLAAAQMRAAGLDQPIFGGEMLVDEEFLARAGKAAEGATLVTDYDPTRTDPPLVDFQKRYTARFGHAPGWVAAHTYDAAQVLLASLVRAGPDRHELMRDLMTVIGRHWHGVTGDWDFDATMNRVGPLTLVRVEGGHFRYLGAKEPGR